jgi:hypothetical protein
VAAFRPPTHAREPKFVPVEHEKAVTRVEVFHGVKKTEETFDLPVGK